MTLKGMISSLSKLEKQWDNRYILFDWSGSLHLVDSADGRIMETYNIRSEGGDPDAHYDKGNLYVKHIFDDKKGD